MKSTKEPEKRQLPNRVIFGHRWKCPEGHLIGEDYHECNVCLAGNDRLKDGYVKEEEEVEEDKEN